MADRSTYNELSDPMPTGLQFLEQYARLLDLIFDTSALPLTAVGGTGNAVTATLDPPVLAGLVSGMKFTLTFAAANTGPVTLALNGGAAVPVVDAAGQDLPSGALATGLRGLIEYVGGVFRLLSSTGLTNDIEPYSTVITASTTWTKPTGYADNALVRIQIWGGGGGGATGGGIGRFAGGGGGGGYIERVLRYADVPTSVVCTIGAGGGAGGGGGNTTFGSLVTAYGGGGGIDSSSSSPSNGGGGGGELGAGGSGSPGPGGVVGGGDGGTNAGTIWGGAGGRVGSSITSANAVFGGAGGGGRSNNSNTSAGGSSLFGGNGGTGSGGAGGAGVAPGGGGGAGQGGGGAGARGEIRIQIFG